MNKQNGGGVGVSAKQRDTLAPCSLRGKAVWGGRKEALTERGSPLAKRRRGAARLHLGLHAREQLGAPAQRLRCEFGGVETGRSG